MSAYDLVLIVLVAGGAFFAGYQIGRFKALSERGSAAPSGADQPLPGPNCDGPFSDRSEAPSRPRGPAPPASAGNDGGSWSGSDAPASGGRGPIRRSTTPPPAAAGLMSKGSADKPDKGQK